MMRAFFTGTLLVVLAIGCAKSDQGVPTAADIDKATETAATTPAEPYGAIESDAPAVTPAAFGIGQPAPNFEGIIGTDDQKHSLKDFADAKAVVVVFTCNKCPVAKAYEDRLIALQKDYADKGAQLVAINVNKSEAEQLPAMKERAEQKGFNFAYLHDPSQKVGRDYGAETTPHIFLLDSERKLAFVGAIDDNHQDESQVKQHYLRDAIDAVLAGNAPSTAETKAVGCGIRYE